mmetsp:Transcript_10310/g.28983  ORF Transcript_10310/g.28983 Transcript_10310/m.28983 type:complete len:202 (-) Transcript_10310:1385-1990(-)
MASSRPPSHTNILAAAEIRLLPFSASAPRSPTSRRSLPRSSPERRRLKVKGTNVPFPLLIRPSPYWAKTISVMTKKPILLIPKISTHSSVRAMLVGMRTRASLKCMNGCLRIKYLYSSWLATAIPSKSRSRRTLRLRPLISKLSTRIAFRIPTYFVDPSMKSSQLLALSLIRLSSVKRAPRMTMKKRANPPPKTRASLLPR